MQYNHALAVLNFNYSCLNILDTAKALKIDWEKAVYSGITTYQVEMPFKGRGTQGITITGANVEFVVNTRKFQLRIEGIYLLDGNWKTAAISGLTEITKQ